MASAASGNNVWTAATQAVETMVTTIANVVSGMNVDSPSIFDRTRLIDVVAAHPRLRWSWVELVLNPQITPQDIIDHPELPWGYSWTALNPNMTLNFAIHHPLIVRNILDIASSVNITMDEVLEHEGILGSLKHVWTRASENPNLTVDFVNAHPEKPWDYKKLSMHPMITREFVLENANNTDANKQLSFILLSSNTSIDIDLVLELQDKDWFWKDVAKNPSISPSYLFTHPTLPWKLEHLVQNPNINEDDIPIIRTKLEGANPEYSEEVWKRLSKHPNITIEYMLRHPEIKWNWNFASDNPNIRWQHVLDHPDKRWSKLIVMENVSRNPKNSPQDVMNLVIPDSFTNVPVLEQYRWDGIAQNPNISPKFVMDNIVHFRSYALGTSLSKNPMNRPMLWTLLKDKKSFTHELLARRQLEAVRDELGEVWMNPDFIYGRDTEVLEPGQMFPKWYTPPKRSGGRSRK